MTSVELRPPAKEAAARPAARAASRCRWQNPSRAGLPFRTRSTSSFQRRRPAQASIRKLRPNRQNPSHSPCVPSGARPATGRRTRASIRTVKDYSMRVSIVRRVNALVALLLVVAYTSAYAHDEDHTSSPPASIASTPRAEAVSEHFELVAVARHGVLTIYLDRLRSNDPVAGATVTVETPVGSLDAVADHVGTYSLVAPWSTQAGRHDLIFTVVSGGSAGVSTAALQVPSTVGPDAEGAARSPTSSTFR